MLSLSKTVTAGIKHRHSQVAIQKHTHYVGNTSVAEMSSPTESGALTQLCTETHPKFSSLIHKQEKKKPFVPKRHHQIMIVKAALDAPNPHRMIQTTASPLAMLRICHHAHLCCLPVSQCSGFMFAEFSVVV